MKKRIFLALMMVLGACTADYDTFDTSDYRELKDISVAEQDGSPAIYSEQHRVEFDLVEVPDSLDTWESVSLDVLSMSHFATLHLVEDKIKEFPTDSAGLDSLAKKVKYSKKTIEQGETIQIPSSHVLYVVVVSESGKKSIWQVNFNIPDVEPEDIVTLFGRDGDAYLPADEVADLSGRFNYELVCDISMRVSKIYRQ